MSEGLSELVFDCSPWENGDWIVTVRPSWEKKWRSAPIGHVVDKQDAKRIVEWANSAWREIEKVILNGYEDPQRGEPSLAQRSSE